MNLEEISEIMKNNLLSQEEIETLRKKLKIVELLKK